MTSVGVLGDLFSWHIVFVEAELRTWQGSCLYFTCSFLSGLNFLSTLGTSVACVHMSEGMDKLHGYSKHFAKIATQKTTSFL
jgi:hypothetical protein